MDSLQKRNLFLFVAGRLISLVGSGIQIIALPLFILDRTGSGAMMGVFTVLSMVPALLAAPIAGVMGDRLNRRSIAVYTDCGRGLLIFLLAWLAFAGRIGIVSLFICQVFVSILDSFFNAATAGMLPDLVDAEDYTRANASKSGVDSLSMIAGPILGGIIYGLWGVKMIFLLNAVSFFCSAFCEWLIVYRQTAKKETKLTLRGSLLENGETLGFIWRQVGLRHLFFFAMFINFLMSPMFMVGLPFLLTKVIGFDSQHYGYLMTMFMAGALLANIILGTFLARTRAGWLMRLGLFAECVVVIGLAPVFFPAAIIFFHGPGWSLFGVLAVSLATFGFFNAFVNTPLQTNMQKIVPVGMRSRFFAVLGLIAQLAVPVGALVYGFFLDLWPPHLFMLGIALLSLAVTLFFLLRAAPEAFDPSIPAAGSAVDPAAIGQG